MRATRVVLINAARSCGHDNPLYHNYKNAKIIFHNKLRFLNIELDRQYCSLPVDIDQTQFTNLKKSNQNCKNRIIELEISEKTYRNCEEITMKGLSIAVTYTR